MAAFQTKNSPSGLFPTINAHNHCSFQTLPFLCHQTTTDTTAKTAATQQRQSFYDLHPCYPAFITLMTWQQQGQEQFGLSPSPSSSRLLSLLINTGWECSRSSWRICCPTSCCCCCCQTCQCLSQLMAFIW